MYNQYTQSKDLIAESKRRHNKTLKCQGSSYAMAVLIFAGAGIFALANDTKVEGYGIMSLAFLMAVIFTATIVYDKATFDRTRTMDDLGQPGAQDPRQPLLSTNPAAFHQPAATRPTSDVVPTDNPANASTTLLTPQKK